MSHVTGFVWMLCDRAGRVELKTTSASDWALTLGTPGCVHECLGVGSGFLDEFHLPNWTGLVIQATQGS